MLTSAPIVLPLPSAATSDAELLACVGQRAVDERAAHEAEAEFYRRHVRYLYLVLMRRVSRPLALTGREVEDLVQETFYRAFERARTFVASSSNEPELEARRTRAWLGRIAKNLLADWLAGSREVSASPYLDTLAEETDDGPASSRSPRRLLLREALDTLSERERDVLRVSALYHRMGEEHQRLPNAAAQELAQRWGTSGENIRAIRSRATKKVRDYLDARLLLLEDDR